jgi:hypothetical protein
MSRRASRSPAMSQPDTQRPSGVLDPDFEPEWLWATRVTAEAARAAMARGRTPQERFAIYERLILAACKERGRRKSPEQRGAIAEATTIPGNLLYDYTEVGTSIGISAFEGTEPTDSPAQ